MQSRAHSMIEAVVNVVAGFGVAMATQYAVFPMYGIHIGHSEHFAIAAFFVVASLIRSYALRRIFNRWHRYEYPEEPFR